MKHLLALVSALVFISATVQADDIKRNKKHKHQAVSVAPFVWGDPSESAPSELSLLSIRKTTVAVAPFVWGSADEATPIIEKVKNKLPVVPFIYGTPDEINLELQNSLARAVK